VFDEKVKLVILLGAPGAGKGTQAERIAAKYNLKHLSTGDLLRAEIENSTELGKSAQAYMNVGKLVPDDVILKMVETYFSRHADCGILLDGFPRTIAQAEGLARFTVGRNILTLSIDVEADAVIERLSSRRSCKVCKKIYNLALPTYPPDERCECGGELYQRDDDKPETIRNRLAVYDAQTMPLIEFYRNQGFLHRIPGSGSPDDVWTKVQGAIG